MIRNQCLPPLLLSVALHLSFFANVTLPIAVVDILGIGENQEYANLGKPSFTSGSRGAWLRRSDEPTTAQGREKYCANEQGRKLFHVLPSHFSSLSSVQIGFPLEASQLYIVWPNIPDTIT